MISTDISAFAALLKRYRQGAGLSQEALAERAGISRAAINALERGARRAPRPETVALLAAALELTPQQRDALASAGRRGRGPRMSPAAGAATRTPGNLPEELTSFIGRDREIADILALLGRDAQSGGTRLITLTGPGGVGKTRVALRVAAMAQDAPDGAWLVDLAPFMDPAFVPRAIADALKIQERPRQTLMATICDHLRDRRLLLVLDNCEHVAVACADLVLPLLECCPYLRVLVTSRVELAITAETLYRIPCLPIPPLDPLPCADDMLRYESIRLFVQRAQARLPGFQLTEENGPATARICVRVDGLPLAIELAAALITVLTVREIETHLQRCLAAQAAEQHHGIARHQTLRATLEWSDSLLSDVERRLLRQLAVFEHGWTLATAAAVCDAETSGPGGILPALSGLVAKSLVQAEPRDGATRYRMLQIVRHYAREQLAATGQEAAARERHLRWCIYLAEEAESWLQRAEQRTWLARLATEHDNLRAALHWSIREGGSPIAGLRLAGALWRYWLIRGHLEEGRYWLDAAIAAGNGAAPAMRAQALQGAGTLAYRQGEYGRATRLLDESVHLWRGLGDAQRIAETLSELGSVALQQGNYEQAATLYDEGLPLARRTEDAPLIAKILANRGIAAYEQGHYIRAGTMLDESMSIERALGHTRGIAATARLLGQIAAEQGEYARARRLLQESLSLSSELGDVLERAHTLWGLTVAYCGEGEYRRAHPLLRECLEIERALGQKHGIAVCLEGFAVIAAMCGQTIHAAQLFGAAEALRRAIDAPQAATDRAFCGPALALVRAALGEEQFVRARAAGRTLSPECAVELALGANVAAAPQSVASS